MSYCSSERSRPPPPAAFSTYGGAPLQRVFTDATASDATADDIDGAGRLTLACAGRGPRNPLKTVLKSLQCTRCSEPYFGDKSSLPPRAASADEVLRALFICSRSCACCSTSRSFRASSDRKKLKASKEFRRILSGSNCSSQYGAILCVIALSSLLPELPAVFLQHDTTHALAILRHRIEHRPDHNLDFLLAPSHCALALLGDIEIHSLGKEIVALTERVSEAATWESALELIHQRVQLYNALSVFWKSSHTAIFVAMIIRTGLDGDADDFASVALDKWPINSFMTQHSISTFRLDYADLTQHLAHSDDPVLNSMLPALLLAFGESYIDNYRLRIQYDIGKGRTPRKGPRTLDILQSLDGERLLRSRLRLIDREDEEFMEYALEDWYQEYSGEEYVECTFTSCKEDVYRSARTSPRETTRRHSL